MGGVGLNVLQTEFIPVGRRLCIPMCFCRLPKRKGMLEFFVRKIGAHIGTVSRVLSLVNFYRPYLYRLQIPVVTHCNLNCKSCGTCSPLAKEEFYDAETLEKDLACLAQKLAVSVVCLLGGEPLLHPEIETLIGIAKKHYPRAFLTLWTNGIRLPEMPRTFWDTLKKNKVTVILQCYPPFKHRLKEYLRLAREAGVRMVHDPHGWIFFRCSFGANHTGREKHYAACGGVGYQQLWRSKLYLCPRHCLEHYNRYFGTRHELMQGYDIYKYGGRELQKLMNRSDAFCRCCTWASRPVATEWGYSKREKWEWCADEALPTKH